MEQRVRRTMVVDLPKKSYNIGISLGNNVFADSNDCTYWWKVSLPLESPKGEWVILKQIETDSSTSLFLGDKY